MHFPSRINTLFCNGRAKFLMPDDALPELKLPQQLRASCHRRLPSADPSQVQDTGVMKWYSGAPFIRGFPELAAYTCIMLRYAITDRRRLATTESARRAALLEQGSRWAADGLDYIQLREKDL